MGAEMAQKEKAAAARMLGALILEDGDDNDDVDVDDNDGAGGKEKKKARSTKKEDEDEDDEDPHGPVKTKRDIATIARWFEKKGYGYMESDLLYNQYGCQIFVHCHDMDDPETDMKAGDEVCYGAMAKNERGQVYATGVRLVRPRPPRANTSVFFSNTDFTNSEN